MRCDLPRLAGCILMLVALVMVFVATFVAILVRLCLIGTKIVDLELRLILRQGDLTPEYLVVLNRRVYRVVEFLSEYWLGLYFFDQVGNFLASRHPLALDPLDILLIGIELLVVLGALCSILYTLTTPRSSFTQFCLAGFELLTHLGYFFLVLFLVV